MTIIVICMFNFSSSSARKRAEFDNEPTKGLPMKTLMISSMLLLISGFAQAADTYQCSNFLPKGSSTLTIESNSNGPSVIALNFHNASLNQDFEGNLDVTYFSANNGGIVAHGMLSSNGTAIEVALQGSLNPSTSGSAVSLVLYANGDRRIENGYGNPLGCERVR
jgi:hypothetical protein